MAHFLRDLDDVFKRLKGEPNPFTGMDRALGCKPQPAQEPILKLIEGLAENISHLDRAQAQARHDLARQIGSEVATAIAHHLPNIGSSDIMGGKGLPKEQQGRIPAMAQLLRACEDEIIQRRRHRFRNEPRLRDWIAATFNCSNRTAQRRIRQMRDIGKLDRLLVAKAP